MKRIITIAALLVASSGSAFAVSNGCNKAVQNWVNGSGLTCAPGNNAHSPDPDDGTIGIVPAAPEIPSTDCAATSGCGSSETVT